MNDTMDMQINSPYLLPIGTCYDVEDLYTVVVDGVERLYNEAEFGKVIVEAISDKRKVIQREEGRLHIYNKNIFGKTKMKLNREESKKKSKNTISKMATRLIYTIAIITGLFLGVKLNSGYPTHVNQDTYYENTYDNNAHQNEMDHQVTVQQEEVKEKEEITQATIEKKEKQLGKKSQIKLGDSFQLNDTKLYYSSVDHTHFVNSDRLNCTSYKIKYMAVLLNDEVCDVIKVNQKNQNKTLQEMKETYRSVYGEDVRFSLNVEGYQNEKKVYSTIGWTSLKSVTKQNHKQLQKTR